MSNYTTARNYNSKSTEKYFETLKTNINVYKEIIANSSDDIVKGETIATNQCDDSIQNHSMEKASAYEKLKPFVIKAAVSTLPISEISKLAIAGALTLIF